MRKSIFGVLGLFSVLALASPAEAGCRYNCGNGYYGNGYGYRGYGYGYNNNFAAGAATGLIGGMILGSVLNPGPNVTIINNGVQPAPSYYVLDRPVTTVVPGRVVYQNVTVRPMVPTGPPVELHRPTQLVPDAIVQQTAPMAPASEPYIDGNLNRTCQDFSTEGVKPDGFHYLVTKKFCAHNGQMIEVRR